ncbi:MAG: class I SAM-dependent methyltransferase [Pseudomonadota bacterium]
MDRDLANQSMEERFTGHYRSGWWFDNGESLSGSGSTLDATQRIREELVPFMQKWDVERLLDAPCGDWNWMQHVPLPADVHYLGADIVPDLIEDMRARYSSERVEFTQIDITADPLPQADMMMCRDALFHLSHADIWRFVDNFLGSSIPHLLTTHMPQIEENRDIVTGKHRPLNLEAAPFNFEPPVDKFADFTPPRREKYMALWTREQLEKARAAA